MALPLLPATFATTRDALRVLACYAISPARKARTGRIGLRSTGAGFGTPPFDDGSRILVEGDRLVREPDGWISITTLVAAAEFLGTDLSPDPGVGHDLPPFAPDEPLAVDRDASLALGGWYAFAQAVLDRLPGAWTEGTISEAQLWPEHFDLAVTVEPAGGQKVNVGFSPGDTFSAEPYAYVGPHDTAGLAGDYWNAPFGAYLPYGRIESQEAALAFVVEGLRSLRRP